MQGYRASMEDTHKQLLKFDNKYWQLWSYFSIFDGHNGVETAKYCADHLDKHMLESFGTMLKEDETEHGNIHDTVRSSNLNLDEFRKAIKRTYYQLDKSLRGEVMDESGSVCITCLIGPEKIYLMHIGDSRAIIVSKDGHVLKATEDHKPTVPSEEKRIKEAGGCINATTGDVLRVENQLAMTRVLGDFNINKDIVPPMADIGEFDRSEDVGYICLACDGIFDVMTNEEVSKFIVEHNKTLSLEKCCAQLLDECLKRNSTDNMSVYIIKFIQQNSSKKNS